MYDELITKLLHSAYLANHGVTPPPSYLREAADAIEELSVKATPKRVGFDCWKGCRNTRYKCPCCNKYVRNDEKYCHKCGQALMFPIIGHTPYVPGKRQEVIISWPDEPPKEE